MKKLFFLLCILTAFVACSDNNDNGEPTPPIENLKMPSAETPFTTGQLVTIEGKGFTTNSQIWLRPTTKATGDIQTKITEVTDNSIVFEVPEGVEGKQNVILKQDGKEYKLGVMTFKISEEALYASNISENNMGLCKLNLTNKTYETVYTSENPIKGLVATDGKIYFLTDNKGSATPSVLGCFNVNDKKVQTIISSWKYQSDGEGYTGEGLAIGIINNQLHGLKYNANKGFYLVQIDNSGKETEIKIFGKIPDFDNNNFSIRHHKFEFNPKDNAILITGNYNKERYPYISFDLKTSEIKIKALENEFNLQLLYVNNDCYLISYSEDLNAIIRKINPQTLENIETPKNLSDEIVRLYYWESKKLVLGFHKDKSYATIVSLDLQKGETNTLWTTSTEFNEFVTTIQ